MLHDAFHQVSAQENIWVGRSCLKKFQEGCLVHDHLWYLSGNKKSISKSLFGLTNPIKVLLNRT